MQWITIPVYQRSLSQRISETRISDQKWAVKHWNTINGSYARAAHFSEYKEGFKQFYSSVSTAFLSEINTELIKLVSGFLSIKTKISNSADFELTGNPTERLVSLCKQVGAGIYLSGPAAKVYLEDEYFKKENIKIEWVDYSGYPEYPQLYPPFEHSVSIIDLLFNVGPSAATYMKFKK